MSKQVRPTLLWEAIVWVQYQYAHLSLPEKKERPQRPYQTDDGKTLSPVIGVVRAAYYAEKVTHGKKADFEVCKKTTMDKLQEKHDWSDATRNFYSSVVSTYIPWDAGRKQSVATKRILSLLSPLLQYVQTD